MATILLASQWGGGAGHARKLLALADGLAARGHQPVLAVPDLIAARRVERARGHRILQGPVWRGRLLKRQPTRSFADIMAQNGFADPAVLHPLTDSWDSLLDSLAPDAVIADYAPMLCLAARDRWPLLCIGVPFCLPPGGMPEFPTLNPEASAAMPEAQLLLNANRWLERQGRPSLAALPAIHPEENSFCFGLSELDPYRDHGRLRLPEPYRPVTDGPLPLPPQRERTPVFAYLSARHKPAMELLLALARQGVLVEASLRDFNRAVARRLAGEGIIVHDGLVDLRQALLRNVLYIHHGSEGAAVDGLLCGRPQLCLPVDLEKQLIGRALRDLGVARLVQRNVATEDAVTSVMEQCADEGVREHARSLSEGLLARQDCQGLEAVLEGVERALASSG
ncbi:MAG: hypothetical protein V2J89_09855 [Halieaceae bacterium]|jgi:hypothetical protein|nr:hypothetical protein [Halieaceae bacterium]